MTPKKHKLDIFRVLGQISKKNQEFFPSLTVEEQKGLQPLIVQRWLSGTRSMRQIMFLNEICCPFVLKDGRSDTIGTKQSARKPLIHRLLLMWFVSFLDIIQWMLLMHCHYYLIMSLWTMLNNWDINQTISRKSKKN